jgi:hypothetical protein
MTGLDQPAIRIVVSEQWRPKPGSGAFGSLRPTTTNSSRLMHLALSQECIGRIGPFRHHPFKL